jgi:hypothetical protein
LAADDDVEDLINTSDVRFHRFTMRLSVAKAPIS